MTAFTLLLLASSVSGFAEDRPASRVFNSYRGAETLPSAAPTVFTGDLRRLPPAPRWRPGDPIKEIPDRRQRPGMTSRPSQSAPRVALADPLLARQSESDSRRVRLSRAFASTGLNFAGQAFAGARPADPVGDVGANHYIQSVNTNDGASVAVYDKVDGTLVSQFALDSLGTGDCAEGGGDPVVVYDRHAQRWLLSEFSVPPSGAMCIYVSRTADPVSGGWYRYQFNAVNSPDYLKVVVWHDAYYGTSSETTPVAYAFERASMLAGMPARVQKFNLARLPGFDSLNALQGADLDGVNAPPVGSPGIFMRHHDDESHDPASAVAGSDFLEIWQFSVDFADAANTTFSGPTLIATAEFDSDLCGLSARSCFGQAGSSVTLDPLREPIMWRLVYFNFGSHENLIGNFVTDVDGADHGGIRWFELRRTPPGSGAWSLHQQGTHAPDFEHRWMGSIAVDGSGNMALGYVTSSNATFPSIRYVGRLRADPTGAMPQGEYLVSAGSGASSSSRWGDYSAMNLDPGDDCTFWHTNMHGVADGTWATRIATMRFNDCGEPGFELAASPANPEVCAPGFAEPVILTAKGLAGFASPISLAVETSDPGITASLSVNPVLPAQSTELTLSVDESVGDGEYGIDVSATAAGADRDLALLLRVATEPAPPVLLVAPLSGSINQSTSPLLRWQAIPGASNYEVEIAFDPAFEIVVVSDITADTSYRALLEPDMTYHWRIKALSACGPGEFSESFSFSTGGLICAQGPLFIPDAAARGPGGFGLSLLSSAAGVLTDVDVILLVSHPSAGELEFTLWHEETGTSVVLIDRPGYPAGDGCENPNIEVYLDDAATDPAENECESDPALSGALQPNEPLAAFNGQLHAGTWTMQARDHVPGFMGTLNQWCLAGFVAPGPDGDGDGVPDTSDNCTEVVNTDQTDTNRDSIGNACDADVAGPLGFGRDDCRVNFLDMQRFKAGFFGNDPDLDLTGPFGAPDGRVNFLDVEVVRNQFFGPPGPSALGCN